MCAAQNNRYGSDKSNNAYNFYHKSDNPVRKYVYSNKNICIKFYLNPIENVSLILLHLLKSSEKNRNNIQNQYLTKNYRKNTVKQFR